MYLLILFLTSFVGLCAIILYRGWEIKKGKVLIHIIADKPIFSLHEIKSVVEKCYSYIPKEFLLHVFEIVISHGRKMFQKSVITLERLPIRNRLYTFIAEIKGRQGIRSNDRPSSAFIQDILKHKEQIRNRRI